MTSNDIYTASDRTPYTYLIGWSNSNIFYYGCQYGKNCHPSKLFNLKSAKSKRYETSSKHVKEFIEIHGLPDVIQIRKIFNSTSKCRIWEARVLNKINAKDNPKFLNKHNGNEKFISRSGFVVCKDLSGKIHKISKEEFDSNDEYVGINFGKKATNATKIKLSISHMGNKSRIGLNHSEETKLKISNSGKGKSKPWTNEHRLNARKSKIGRVYAFNLITKEFSMIDRDLFKLEYGITYLGGRSKEAIEYKLSAT